MANRTFRLEVCQLDLDLWQKLYYLHQKEYQRQRLWAIKYLYEGQSREEKQELKRMILEQKQERIWNR